jgi:hypothetical protein
LSLNQPKGSGSPAGMVVGVVAFLVWFVGAFISVAFR